MTYGLRLEHEQGTQEKSDQIIVAFDEAAVSPLDARVNKAGTLLQGRTINGGLVYAGQDGFPNYQGDPPAIKLAPRVGVVYAMSPDTVVRGGYGLFYAPWNYPAPGDTSYGNRGFTQVSTMAAVVARADHAAEQPVPERAAAADGQHARPSDRHRREHRLREPAQRARPTCSSGRSTCSASCRATWR